MKPRQVVGRAFVGGLCVSAAVAVLALLSGSFDEVHWRVIGTSLGFSVFTSTGEAGLALRVRSDARLRMLGSATAGVSLAALVFLVAALWIDESEQDWLWRGFGVAALAALWTSHASLMLGALRPTDSPAVRVLSQISAFTLGIETFAGVAAIVGMDVGEGINVLAALIVVTVVTTVLAPLLRRMGSTTTPSTAATAVGRGNGFAAEVAQSAQRLSTMDLPAPAQAEVDHLRRLARDAGG
jgi:hypothetical protein